MSSSTLERGKHAATSPTGIPKADPAAGDRTPRRARADQPMMTVMRIDQDGGIELVAMPATWDEIAGAVGGRHYEDRAARFCFPMPGAGYVTFWQADSADDSGCPVNRAAMDLLDRFLPRPAGDLYDRDRVVLDQRPVSGLVVIAGYDRENQLPTSLSGIAVGRFRSALDGRDARRKAARVNAAETVALPALVPATATLDTAGQAVGGRD